MPGHERAVAGVDVLVDVVLQLHPERWQIAFPYLLNSGIGPSMGASSVDSAVVPEV
jgi:hypothetical protein